MAHIYLHNFGDSQENLSRTFKLFKLAADQGEMRAQLKFAQIYHNGISTKINHEMAIKYYKMSASQGNFSAKFCLQNLLCVNPVLVKVICSLLYRINQNKKTKANKNKLAEHLRLYPGNDYIKAMQDFYHLVILN